MKSINKELIFINFIIILICTYPVFGDWKDQKELVNVTLGQGSNQVGYMTSDTMDIYAQDFLITSKGDVILWDVVNERITLFDDTGKMRKIIIPDQKIGLISLLRWGVIGNINFIIKSGENYQIYDLNGEVVRKFPGVASYVEQLQVLHDNSIIVYKSDENKYYHYSMLGQLLKTYNTQPPELGLIKESNLGNKKVESTVEYPDYTYKVSTAVWKYSRDMFVNFYDILFEYKKFDSEVQPVICYKVIRVDRCTGEEYIFEPPRSEFAGYSPEEANSPAPRQEVKIAYGEPIVSPLGDLYYWGMTKTNYKILKWTWQGPEDAPQSLQISSGVAGLKLNWQKPVKDSGTVTGYQILRSSEVCGPFNEVTTVKKDKLSFEDQTIKPPWKYYYVVKAVRDKKASGDSNKVYMQWK